jgi:heme oxygenase
MSEQVKADFIAALDQATRAAEADVARLQELRRQTERDRAYRDLLLDMQQLLNALSSPSAEATLNRPEPDRQH